MSSKEIARETGLAPISVDTYIKQAIARLGASNRREAARILEHFESSQNSGSPSAGLVPPAGSSPESIRIGGNRRRSFWRLPPIGGETHALGWQDKTTQILQIAIVTTAVGLGLALGMAGLFEVLR